MRKPFIVTAALLLSLVIALPVFADEAPKAPTLTDSLVVAYDFEGDIPIIQLQDKAPGGKVRDDLELNGNVRLENGVALCGKTQGGDSLFAPPKTEDLKNLTEHTVYLKVKVENPEKNLTSPNPQIFSVPGLGALSIVAENADTGVYTLRPQAYNNKKWVSFPDYKGGEGNPEFTEKDFMYIAISAKLNADTNKVTMNAYFSKDGVTYENSRLTQDAGATESFNATGGKYCLTLGESTRNIYTVTFDDFFVFNRALSAEELPEVSKIKLEPIFVDPTATTETVTTEQPAPVTTPAPAKTTAEKPVTQAPPAKTTEVPAAQTTEKVTEPTEEKKGGCSSALSAASIAAVALMSIGTAVFCKQKEEK